MVEEVLRHDPLYAAVLQDPLPLEETPEFALFQSLADVAAGRTATFRREFDRELCGRVSRLVDWKANNEEILASSVREILGLPAPRSPTTRRSGLVPRPGEEPAARRDADADDARQALARALPPVLHVPQEALAHGRQPGPAPPHDARLAAGAAGVSLRRAGLHRPDARRRRAGGRGRSTARRWRRPGRRSRRLRSRGVADEYAAYLLPNAVAIRFTESADLPEPPPQVRDAPLLQRAGGDLARLARRSPADPRGQSEDRPVAPPALHAPPPRAGPPRLSRGRPLLRRRRLETGRHAVRAELQV